MDKKIGILLVCGFIIADADARLFSDDQGRQVDAELIGVRGEYAVLQLGRRSARWPINKLSAKDQRYVEKWQKTPSVKTKITASVWERDGIGPAGEFPQKAKSGLPDDIPLLQQTQKKVKFKHYDAHICNRAKTDARQLTVAYVIYILEPGGRVSSQNGSTLIDTLEAGKGKKIPTKGISGTRTKTTRMTLNIGRGGDISTGSKTSRAKERFGGAWIRVYTADGTMVAESKKLHESLEKIDPAWTGDDGKEQVPVISKLDALKKLLQNLPELPGIEDIPIPEEIKDKLPKPPAEKPPFPPHGFPVP